jgi:hypothetical protein
MVDLVHSGSAFYKVHSTFSFSVTPNGKALAIATPWNGHSQIVDQDLA